jgi:hypothetical protein
VTTFVRTIILAFTEARISKTWPDTNWKLLSGTAVTTLLYTALAVILDRDPNVTEVLFTFLSQAGCVYHLVELQEAIRQRLLLARWEEADIIDRDVVSAEVRHHFLRWAAKSCFLFTGMVFLFLPPRVDAGLDLLQAFASFLLILGVLFLDLTAISDYTSRMWRIGILPRHLEERERRRDKDV